MPAPLQWAAFLCGAYFLAFSGLPASMSFAAALLLAAGWLGAACYPSLERKFPALAAKLPLLALTAILAFAVAMRVRMAHMPVWIDEMVTIHFCRLPWSEVARHLGGPRELMFPTALFLYRSIYPFTHDPAVLRAVNVLLGTAAVYTAFRIGSLAHSRKTGLWFAFLLSCAVYVTYYTIELRSYGLLLSASFCSVYFFLRELRAPTARGLRWYAYSTAVMLYAHQGGMALFAMQAAVWLLFWRPLRLQAGVWCRCFLFIALMGSVVFWYEAVLKYGQFRYCMIRMYPGPHLAVTFAEAREVAYSLFLRPFFLAVFSASALLALSQRVPGALRFFRQGLLSGGREALARHYRIVALALLCVGPVVWLFFWRVEQRAVFFYSWRYVLPSLGLGCFFLGLAVSAIKGKGARMWAVTLAVMVGSYSFVGHWYNRGYVYHEGMDITPERRILKARLAPNDRIAFLEQESYMYWQVANEFGKPVAWVTSPQRMLSQLNEFRSLDAREEEIVASSRDLLPGQRLWVLVSAKEECDPGWRWLLSDPEIRMLEKHTVGSKYLYLFQRR